MSSRSPLSYLFFKRTHHRNSLPSLIGKGLVSYFSGYLLKKSAAAELVQAIYAAIEGERYVIHEIARGMQEAFIQNPEGSSKRTVLTASAGSTAAAGRGKINERGRSCSRAVDILFSPFPRTVDPDHMTIFNPMYMISRRPPPIETVGGTTTVGKYVISDDERQLQIWHVQDMAYEVGESYLKIPGPSLARGNHSADMLMA